MSKNGVSVAHVYKKGRSHTQKSWKDGTIHITVDILGPLKLKENGNKYLMVVIPNQEAAIVAKPFIKHVVVTHGVS